MRYWIEIEFVTKEVTIVSNIWILELVLKNFLLVDIDRIVPDVVINATNRDGS